MRAVNWRGARGLDDGKSLHADLGRTKAVHIRWRQAGGSGNAHIRVQEAALWQIDPGVATLYAAFDYRITQGNVTAFKVLLPPNLEVSRLEVRPEINPRRSAAVLGSRLVDRAGPHLENRIAGFLDGLGEFAAGMHSPTEFD